MTARVLLVADHSVMQEGLRVLLGREDDIKVVGVAGDGRTAVEMVRKSPPDVVVMEAVLPVLNGVEATRQIHAEAPGVRVVGMSVHNDHSLGPMMQGGSSAYFGKADTVRNLVEAIRQVQAGHKYVSPQLIDAFAEYLQHPDDYERSVLTAREREVLQLVAEGGTAKEISTLLVVSETTARSHLRRLMHKLGLHTVAALTKYAIRTKITSLHP